MVAHPTLSRGGWALALVLLSGCDRLSALTLPVVASDGSLLLALPSPVGPHRIYAVDEQRPLTALVAPDDAPIYVLVYEVGLQALGLDAGELLAVDPQQAGRPLPPGAECFALSGEARTSLPIERPLVDMALGRPLPALEDAACSMAKGCVRLLGDGHDLYCEAPCARPPEPEAPQAPDPVAPPELTPCPSAWSAVERDGVMVCEPPAARVCGPGQFQPRNAAECTPIGNVCPSGRFSAQLPPGKRALYVDPGEAAGGDGSAARPFNDLSNVAAAALEGDVLVLAAGVYDVNLQLDLAIGLVGRCASDTVLQAADSARPVIEGRPTLLQDLSVQGGSAAAVRITGGESLLSGLDLSSGSGPALAISAAMSEARGLYIHGALGGGVLAESSALRLYDLVLADLGLFGVSVARGSLRLENSRLLRVAAPAGAAHAIQVSAGATLDLVGVSLSQVDGAGLALNGAGLSAIDDLLLRGAGSLEQYAIEIAGSEPATLARVDLADTVKGGLLLVDGRASLRDSRFVACPLRAVATAQTSWLELDRVLFARTAGIGMNPVLAQLDLRDVRFLGHRAGPNGFGFGVALLYDQAWGTIERVEIDGAVEIGIFLLAPSDLPSPLLVTMTSVQVRNVSNDPADRYGAGHGVVATGYDLDLSRLKLDDNAGKGLSVDNPLHDTASRVTDLSAERNQQGGVRSLGGPLELRRAWLADNAGEAVEALGSVNIFDLRAVGPAPSRALAIGIDMYVTLAEHVRADRAVISGFDYGLRMRGADDVVLNHVLLEANNVGVATPFIAFAAGDRLRDVAFIDNIQNLARDDH